MIGLFVGLSAFAADQQPTQIGSYAAPSAAPAATPNPNTNWRDLPEASCGMMCRYHRANDNLTFQALYLITKLGKIDDAIKNKKDTEAKTAMGGICKNSDESASDCFQHYQDFQKVALFQIRQSIGKNEEMIARLMSGRQNDGTVTGDAVAFQSGAANTPYIPEVYTVSDLEKSYIDGKLKPAGGKYSNDEIKKWSMQLVGATPNNQRYLEFSKTPIEANPTQPESKTRVQMIVRDSGGNAQSDSAVIKSVEKAQKSIKDVSSGAVTIGQDAKLISPKEMTKDDSISHDALTQTRSILNGKITEDSQKETNRSPAGKDTKSVDSKSPDGKSNDPAKSTDPATLKSSDLARDLSVEKNDRSPAGRKVYEDEERVKMPEGNQNSRYFRYNMNDLFNEIEDSTKH